MAERLPTPAELTELLPGKHEWDSGEAGGADGSRTIGFASPKLGLRQRRQSVTASRGSLRHDVWTVLRFRSSVAHRSSLQRASYVFELCILTLILLNVLLAMGISNLIDGESPEVAYLHSDWYDTFLTASTVIFSVEYALRLWSCVEDERFTHPVFGRLTWMVRPMSVIDLVVLVPFYVELLFKYSLTPSNKGVLTLRALRLLRVLSFLRLERSYNALRNLRTILSKKKAELGLVTYMTGVVVLTSSITIFFFENEAQPEVFSSIGVSAWWAVETITSLGYGDIVPVTSGGRIFSSVLALWGIILFTIPGAVLSSGFVEVMLEKERDEKEAMHQVLQRTLSHGVFSMSTANLNNMFLNGQFDSPRTEPSPMAPAAPANADIERLQEKVEQLTKSHERLQAQLSIQEVHLHAILKLLESSQPRPRRLGISTDPPPFTRITIPSTAPQGE
ncbi:hypothetical protein PybrP1_011146 [[Pythium] brassicae (nom. inval.)]|nr:hypothetical protein PybrP1_011146 [[Pythium] brassicae (nom. inval.)]